MRALQRIGGVAAVLQVVTFVVALLDALVYLPTLGFVPADYLDPVRIITLSGQHPNAVIGLEVNDVGNIGFALWAYALAYALARRAEAVAAPGDVATLALTRASVAAAAVAGALFVASGTADLAGFAPIARLYHSDAAQAVTAYRSLGAVVYGVANGATFTYGWSVLLAGIVALRVRSLPRVLGVFALLWGADAILALFFVLFGLFGAVLGIIWCAGLGVYLLVRALPRGAVTMEREPALVGAPAERV